MKKLFDEKPVLFAVIWIVIYVMGTGTLGTLTDNAALNYGLQLAAGVVIAAVLLCFAKKHGLMQHWYMQKYQGDRKRVLFYIPLLIAMTENLWCGFGLREDTAAAELLGILSVGMVMPFLEELILRAVLFRAIAKSNVRNAFWITTVTFGAGHIINLLFGKGSPETVIQVGYALCIGFALTALMYAGRSILPTTAAHMLMNTLSFFGASGAEGGRAYAAVGTMCVICIAYGIFVLQRTETRLPSAPDGLSES